MAITKLSADGVSNYAHYNSMAAGNVSLSGAQFVITTGTNCITSTDGFTWTQRTITGGNSDVAYFNKVNGLYRQYNYNTSGIPQASFSTDAITWNTNTRWGGIAGNSNVQRVNDDGTYMDYTTSPTSFWHTADGRYAYSTGITNAYVTSGYQVGSVIVSAAQRYTTTGQPTIAYSTDGGVNWGTNNMGGSEAQGTQRVAYGNGTWVVSGGSTGAWYSTNGSTWTQADSSVNGQFVWYAGGLFICGAFTGGGLYTSSNGITWTARTSNVASRIRGAFYGNGLYVAYGASGVVTTSPDGITWTARTSNTTGQLLLGIYA